MTHEKAKDRLLDLAYGELSKREARKVEAHAASCEACGAELGRIRGTRRVMSALPHEPAPAEGERILLAAAREAARARAPRGRRPWLWGGAVAALSAAAVVAVSYRVLELRPGPLEPKGQDALLGDSPYARAPAPEAAAPDAADAARAPPEARAVAEPERPAAKSRRDPPAAPVARPPPAVSAPAARPPPAAPREAPAPRVGAAPQGSGPPPEARAEMPARRSRAAAEAAPAAAAEARDRSPAPAAEAPRAPPAQAARPRAEAPEGVAGAEAETGRAEALVRYGELRDGGRLRGEIRTFPGCEGEAWRKVETDPAGRVVKYVREGRIGGRRLRIEHVYDADGALAAATVRDLDEPGAPVDADALGLALPALAREAAIAAPPRCGR